MRTACRLFVTLLALAAIATQAAASAGTEVKTYRPLTAQGHLRYALHLHHGSGTCWTASEAVARRGSVRALRCMSGNVILDPCFGTRFAARSDLVCVDAPWDRSGLRLALARKVPTAALKPGGGRNAWGIVLRGGTRCLFEQGATNVVHGRRLNYTCNNKTYLWGVPDRRTPYWRIRSSKDAGGRGMHFVAISRVWR